MHVLFERGRSDHRDRIGSNDGRRLGGQAHRFEAVPQTQSCGDRIDQFDDAMHDERSVRTMHPTTHRPDDEGSFGSRVLMLQSGSRDGLRRFRQSQAATEDKQRW